MDPIDALYARQSLDKKDSISIESQLEFCRYETRGAPYETYVDRGFSGKSMQRPAFSRMMEDVRAGKIKRVIVYKLDRISRSVLDFSNMMQVFQNCQVEFVSSTEKFDTSTPIGNAMLNISIVFAQLERETIQKRVADAYHSRSRKGCYMGGRIPYGFRLQKTLLNDIHTSVLVPEPNEAAQIRRIYEWYAEPDVTLGAVIRKLTVLGMAKKRENFWCTARLSEIFRNPVYVRADMDVYHFLVSHGCRIANPAADFTGTNGIFLYNGGSCGDVSEHRAEDRERKCELGGGEAVLGLHEGIIDSHIWLKCRQKLMQNRCLARTRKGKRTWLSGKVKCAKCGYACTVIKSNTKAGRYFQCSGSRYSVRCSGPGSTVYADVLEDYVGQEIKKLLDEFEYLSGGEARRADSEENICKIQIAELDKEIDSLLLSVKNAGKTLMQYINRQVEELDARKRLLQEKLAKNDMANIQTATAKITGCAGIWEKLSLEDKQRAADVLIERIRIGENVIEIFWRI
ncbi:MAG: recombinase family protein [Eubacteriales bacterium]|nr:recombinase family protein [Eubacteriales bacterium]